MRRAWILVAAALVGCGGGKSGSNNNNNNNTQQAADLATFCNNAVGATTTVTTACLHANPDFLTGLTTFSLYDCSALAKEVAAGRVSYDSGQAAACASAIGSATCQQLVDEDVPASCKAALTGKVANGGACYNDVDCASGTCNASVGTCPGVCQAFAQLGDSCASANCAPGLACDGSPSTCKTASAENGACPCRNGLWCDASGGAPGVCKALPTSGPCVTSGLLPCQVGYQCVGSQPGTCQSMVGLNGDCTASDALCGPGYVCDAATHQCVSFPKIGEACGAAGLCIASFCDFLGTQKCVAYKHVGDACAQTDLIPCEPGSTCDTTTSKCTVKPLCF